MNIIGTFIKFPYAGPPPLYRLLHISSANAYFTMIDFILLYRVKSIFDSIYEDCAPLAYQPRFYQTDTFHMPSLLAAATTTLEFIKATPRQCNFTSLPNSHKHSTSPAFLKMTSTQNANGCTMLPDAAFQRCYVLMVIFSDTSGRKELD